MTEMTTSERVYISEGVHYLIIKRSFPNINKHLRDIKTATDELKTIGNKTKISKEVESLIKACTTGVDWKIRTLQASNQS